ncbi:hypothetical protein [Rhizobium sp. RAF56]|uniref:hypothetical protein n=1 Tax=Rhizobium sp. RAF56 TaxID=3233062 RepID=UPI003F99100B
MPAIQREVRQPLDHFLQKSGVRDWQRGTIDAVSRILGIGGDKRIWPDEGTRRNRYGTLAYPAGDEISFSSTTASNISDEGFLAVAAELERLADSGTQSPVALDRWFGDLRGRIARNFGYPDAEIVLAPSGTDVELLAACIFAGLSRRPLTNVLVAPEETGSGVPVAAGGCHFSDLSALGTAVQPGALLEGLEPGRIFVRTIAIREPSGKPRRQGDIDTDLAAAVKFELMRDRDVLIHVLDTSKTGLAGVSRQAARQLSASRPDRVRVLVDACQLRCPVSVLKQDVADGFAVAVTGSKFVAGPPFSGALLMPTALAEEFAQRSCLPAGLSAYTAARDWPAALRRPTRLDFAFEYNLGLGLRWSAALAHLDRYCEIPESRQSFIKGEFARIVRSRLDASRDIFLHADDDGDHLFSRAIVPLTIQEIDGRLASFEKCQRIHALMRESDKGPVCHMGQAVRVGSRAVLRVAASAADVLQVSARMAAGQSLDRALGDLMAKFDILFDKLSAVKRE